MNRDRLVVLVLAIIAIAILIAYGFVMMYFANEETRQKRITDFEASFPEFATVLKTESSGWGFSSNINVKSQTDFLSLLTEYHAEIVWKMSHGRLQYGFAFEGVLYYFVFDAY